MIAVIFEVWPKEDGREAYFGLASDLRPLLEGIEGFLSIERFTSLTDPDKVLSLSFWRDEEAVAAWRRQETHRAAQREGIERLFSDYRIRVATVVRDRGMASKGDDSPDGPIASSHESGGRES